MNASGFSRFGLVLISVAGLALGVQAQPATQPAAQPATAPAPIKTGVTHPGRPRAVDPSDQNRYGIKQAKPKAAGDIRIATYNVENLYDDKDDPKLDDKFEKDMTKPKANCEAAAKAIRAVNADVLALEEVESKEAVLWFRDTWLKDMGYQYVSSIDAGDERGIEQAVLSRFPITKEQNWPKAELGAVAPAGTKQAGEPQKFHRSPLMVTIEVPSATTGGKPYELTLFVVHQKSGKESDWGWFRQIESKKITSLIREVELANPSSNIVLLGDFNATSADESFKTYLTAGLMNVFSGKDNGRNPDFVTHASGRCIDHILISRTMSQELNPQSIFVLGTPILPEGTDFKLAKELPGYASDHFPVVMDLKPLDGGAAQPASQPAAQPASQPAAQPGAKTGG